MFFTSFRAQFNFALRQRASQLVFWLLFLLVGLNYASNVVAFQGMDLTNMYHPMKLLTLSYNRIYYNSGTTLLIVQIYPLLVACPAGLIYAREKSMGMNTLVEGRIGGVTYKFSKLLAVFCSTSLIFALPFLIEILLNCIAFPSEAIGDFSYLNSYDSEYLQWVEQYAFHELYASSPCVYAVAMTFIFGILSGILGMAACAFSMIVPVNYRLMYLMPTFIVLNSTIYFWDSFFDFGVEVRWYNYFLIFNEEKKSMLGFTTVLFALVCASIISAYISGRRDCIER